MLTEEQKTQYNRYRAEGLPPERALSIATRGSDNQYNPALEAGVDNILFGEKSLASSIGKGFKEATVGGFKDIYDNTKKYGAGEALYRAPLSLLAGAGRGVGEVFGGVLETADDLTGEKVSSAVQPHLEKFAGSERGQKLIAGAQDFNEKTHGVAGDVLDILNLAGLGGVVKAGSSEVVKQTFQKTASTVVSGANKAKDTTQSGLKSVFGRTEKVPETPKTPDVNVNLNFNTLEEAVKSPKSGITSETPGIKSSIADNRLSVPDKEFLVELDSKVGLNYLEKFKASEKSHKADSIFTVAVKDSKKAFDDYVKQTNIVGSEIGKVKQKIAGSLIDSKKIDSIITDLKATLKNEGLKFTNGAFVKVKDKTSTLNSQDIKLLNESIGNLKNIKKQGTGAELNNVIKVLDGIAYLQNTTKTKGIDTLAKKIRKHLDTIRKTDLNDAEKKLFDEYSQAIGFINDFNKGKVENKLATLLNKAGSKWEGKLDGVSEEIQRVTGQSISQYGLLTKVLARAAGSESKNISLLKQHFNQASIDSLISPVVAGKNIVSGTFKRLFDADMLEEIEKAIRTNVIRK